MVLALLCWSHCFWLILFCKLQLGSVRQLARGAVCRRDTDGVKQPGEDELKGAFA